MKEAIVAYISEMFGGILIVLFTFWLTRKSETKKASEQLENQKRSYIGEKESLTLKYDANKCPCLV